MTGNNRVQEVAKSSGTQWSSPSMTANDIYTVAGDPQRDLRADRRTAP